MKKTTIIQLPLEGHVEQMFEDIFVKTGMKSRSEYLRYLISEEFIRQGQTLKINPAEHT